jgi:hypothetical protein
MKVFTPFMRSLAFLLSVSSSRIPLFSRSKASSTAHRPAASGLVRSALLEERVSRTGALVWSRGNALGEKEDHQGLVPDVDGEVESRALAHPQVHVHLSGVEAQQVVEGQQVARLHRSEQVLGNRRVAGRHRYGEAKAGWLPTTWHKGH